MKNIHLLPTDKPSRIYLIKSNNRLGITSNNPEFTENFGSGTQNQNIYITSDEEIKEGVNQWYLDKFLNKPRNSSGSQYGEKQNVIILTTDQDLIIDGVQAIDDEFLEWFVKNPSCEKVEVEDWYNKFLSCCRSKKECHCNKKRIIIPKEETKEEMPQIGTKEFNDLASAYFGGKPKQETLEEASKYYAHNYFDMHETNNYKALKQGFEAGAKWQAERMYSEEDMKEYSEFCIRLFMDGTPCIIAKDWFKQFKKK